jgi:peroxiredoxin
MEENQKTTTVDPDGGHETTETAAKEKMAFEKSGTSRDSVDMMDKHSSYQNYSPETAKTEQAAGHKVVLFFHADWCPFCVEADKQFKAKLDQIPQGVTVLKTNYDTETALKKKYAVTYQHTFVQIDAEGNLSSKWNSGDIDNLKKNLK